MLKDTSLHTSPQLALVEQQGVAVVLTPKQVISLYKKSQYSEIPFDTLKEVYQRGYRESLSEQAAFNRVNSFIYGGAAAELDKDLLEAYFSQTKPKQGFEHKGKLIGAISKTTDGYISRRRKDPDKKTSVHLMQKHKTREDAEKHLISKSGLGEELSEKRGLWDNIHAKQERIKHGSGEHMRKPGAKGAPTSAALKNSQTKEDYTGTEKVSKNSDDASSRFVGTNSLTDVYKKSTPGYTNTVKRVVKEHCECMKKMEEDAKGYKNPNGGLTQKGRDHYNRESGGHLKAPVTTPPSELKAGSKSANRRKSFCARMGGVEGPMKKPNGEPTRKALALRKWNC
jgi:hypothetical protein